MIESSVIILTKNAGERFDEVLKAVFNQKKKSFEVIIMDSESTDNTISIAKKYKTKIIKISPTEFKHGKTRNFGAKIAKGKYLVYLTHDAVPANSNWLFELVSPLKNKRIAGVYARQVPRKNENMIDKFFYLSLYPSEDKIWGSKNYSQGDNIFSDVSSAIRKDVLLKYPFDNDIIVSEDYEWAKKILSKGYELFYSSNAQVIHSHSYNFTQLFKRCFDIGVSYKEIYQKEKTKGFLIKGVKIHIKQLQYLFKNKVSYLIPYAIFKDAVKFLAINLGKQSHLLPNVLNRKLSNYPRYWR